MSDAADWLAKARSDLDMVDRAMTPVTNQNLEQAAYHLQQAAEKAIKALLVHLDVEFQRWGGKGHDIGLLARQVPPDHHLREKAVSLESLTPWSTASRYPSEDPDTALQVPGASEIEALRSSVGAFVSDVAAEIEKPEPSDDGPKNGI
jgi:HEPN domain-containing protein